MIILSSAMNLLWQHRRDLSHKYLMMELGLQSLIFFTSSNCPLFGGLYFLKCLSVRILFWKFPGDPNSIFFWFLMIIHLTLVGQLNSTSTFYGIMGTKFIELMLCNKVYRQLRVEGEWLLKDADSGKPCSGIVLDEERKKWWWKGLQIIEEQGLEPNVWPRIGYLFLEKCILSLV